MENYVDGYDNLKRLQKKKKKMKSLFPPQLTIKDRLKSLNKAKKLHIEGHNMHSGSGSMPADTEQSIDLLR